MQSTQPAEDTDTALMRAVASGDRLAIGQLYDRHAAAVYGVAMSVLRDQSLALDVSQEAFLRLWRRAETFDPARGTALGWLVAVARNLALDELRRQRRRAEGVERLAREMDAVGQAPAQQLLDWGWESDRVHEAVAQLSSLQRETVELVYMQGYTLVEVAARLEVAVGTVKSRLHSALLSLRAALAGSHGAAGSVARPPTS